MVAVCSDRHPVSQITYSPVSPPQVDRRRRYWLLLRVLGALVVGTWSPTVKSATERRERSAEVTDG